MYIEIKDIAEEVSRAAADIDFDPNRLDFINEQLDKIYHLEKKFHVETIAELLEIQANLKLKLDSIDNSDELLKDAEQTLVANKPTVQNKAAILTKGREKNCKNYSERNERKTHTNGHSQCAVRYTVRGEATC